MTDYKPLRLSKIARDFGVGVNTVLDFLHKKGIAADDGPKLSVSWCHTVSPSLPVVYTTVIIRIYYTTVFCTLSMTIRHNIVNFYL